MTTIQLTRSSNIPRVFINSKLPHSTLELIDKTTSYLVQGYEYSEKWQSGEWDGYIHLLKKTPQGIYFLPVGLTWRVINILKALGYEVQYQTKLQRPAKSIDFEWNGPELWPFQKDIINSTLTEINTGNGCVIASPTGSGKSLMGTYLIKEFGVPTLLLVHLKDLVGQWKRVLKETLDIDAAVYGSGKREHGDVTIAMMQSLAKNKQFDYEHYKFLISDECHHLPCTTLWEIAMKSNAFLRCGLSATPKREQGDEIKIQASMGKIIQPVTPKDLIELGFLTKPRLEVIRAITPQTLGYNWATEYKNGIVLNEARNHQIATRVLDLLDENLQVYVHVTQIVHGTTLARLIGCPFISGKTPKKTRETEIEKFRQGTTRCLVATLLGEGFDIPSMDVIVLASGGKSEVALVQRIGRVLRKAKGKEEALVIDFADSGKHLRQHSMERFRVFRETYGE